MFPAKKLTTEQAFQKLRHYCGYQERCHSEVKEKLASLGIGKKDTEELVSRLIEEDYLNEERFAKAFAGGRFRLKQWSRPRIRYELKQRNISEYCISRAMQEIPDQDYLQAIHQLVQKKWESLKGEQPFVCRQKCFDFLRQKGFETPLIQSALEQVSAA